MALQIWLPLTGNLNNQGLKNITVTNNSATIDNSGIIGKCYNFGNGTSTTQGKGININDNLTTIVGEERSICAWVRPKGNHLHYSGAIASSGNWNSIRWAFCLKQDNTGFTGFDSSFSTYYSTNIPINEWTHLCVTVKNGITSFYKNGIYLGEQTRGSGFLSSDANNTMIGRETYASGYFSFNGDICDVRIYDHTLSPKEVKEISQGLFLHWQLTDDNLIDASGYSNNGSISGTIGTLVNAGVARYNTYIEINNDIITGELPAYNLNYTFSIWAYPQKLNTFILDCRNSSGNGYQPIYITPGTIQVGGTSTAFSNIPYSFSINKWYHIVVVYTNSDVKVYINGSKIGETAASRGYNYNTNLPIHLGSQYSEDSNTMFNGYLSDFRIYSTALSDQDILNLYQTSVSIDNNGNIYSYKFRENEDSSIDIKKTGIVLSNNFIEINDKLKVLSDGSVFLQILHHNNPSENLFTEKNAWFYNSDNLYSNLILLKNCPLFNNLTNYEFLVYEKTTSSATEHELRWSQTSNPALSSTLSGYTVISGTSTKSWGLMNKGTYGCFHNGASWYCCCGSWSAYSGGIPGFEGIVTTGYLDLYIKIPADNLKGNIDNICEFFPKSIKTNQLIEK